MSLHIVTGFVMPFVRSLATMPHAATKVAAQMSAIGSSGPSPALWQSLRNKAEGVVGRLGQELHVSPVNSVPWSQLSAVSARRACKALSNDDAIPHSEALVLV